MLCNISFISHLQWIVLCTSHVLPNCSDGAKWNIGCRLDCLELVIVQPGSVILMIALPSLRHLVITHLSIGLAGQSLWLAPKCDWQVIYMYYILFIYVTGNLCNQTFHIIPRNFQAFHVMPGTTSQWALDQFLSQGGWLAGITFSVNLGTPLCKHCHVPLVLTPSDNTIIALNEIWTDITHSRSAY